MTTPESPPASVSVMMSPVSTPTLSICSLPTGNVVTSTPTAAAWIESQAYSTENPSPGKLGFDVGYFQLATPAVFIPDAVVLLFGPGGSGS